MDEKNEDDRKKMEAFKCWLVEEEKSRATVEKYRRDIRKFYEFLPEDKEINRERVLLYKSSLLPRYQVSSANSILMAVNSFLSFCALEN